MRDNSLSHHPRLVAARNNAIVIICIVERNDLATWRVSPSCLVTVESPPGVTSRACVRLRATVIICRCRGERAVAGANFKKQIDDYGLQNAGKGELRIGNFR